MFLTEVLEAIAGVAVVLAILADVFLTVVVPRRAPKFGRLTRVSGHIIPRLWRVWRAIGVRMESTERREAFLGMYGSLGVILLLVAWATGLIVGYGLILDAVRAQIRPEPENLGAALYSRESRCSPSASAMLCRSAAPPG
jgi:hypothetical protein